MTEETWIPPQVDTEDVDPKLVAGRNETRQMVKEALRPSGREGPGLPGEQITNMHLLYVKVARAYLDDPTMDAVLDDRCRYVKTALDHLREVSHPDVVAQGDARAREIIAAQRQADKGDSSRPDGAPAQRTPQPPASSGK